MSERLTVFLLLIVCFLSSVQCSEKIQDNASKSSQDRWNGVTRELATTNDTGQGRTFGLRRLKVAIPLIMFKLGAMTTLLGFLTLIAIKTLSIVVLLLISHVSGFLAKFHHLKHGYGHDVGHTGPQDIHLHIHKDGHEVYHGGGHEVHHGGPYHGWDRTDTTTEFSISLSRLKYLNSLYQQAV